MRAVIQRVTEAQVISDGILTGKIEKGLAVLLGIHAEDTDADIQWLVKKISQMRIFSDEDDKMNLSLSDIKGSILLLSQFTLYASTKKGNRPSFITAAPPITAIPLYERFVEMLKATDIKVETGVFGADMQLQLVNDGPVTIIIDSKNPE
ncbi:MAG: D-aminoacyl-tRNA deacylase [Chitinophagales bacterium]|nr:D-aminoacyl-tRNA deacylase [Chitinophagales bacterium]